MEHEDSPIQGHWRADWDSTREAQILHMAAHTTPLQRLQWLEEMLQLLGPRLPELLRNREQHQQRTAQ